MFTVAPIDDMEMHMVFCIWGTPDHTGNMPDFLSYLSKKKLWVRTWLLQKKVTMMVASIPQICLT